MSFYEHFASRDRNKLGEIIKKRFARKVFDLSASFGKIKSILEIGPGDGYIADIATEVELRYTAIEGSQAVVDKLAERNIDAVCAYVPPIPPLNQHSDCCIMLHVLEHMDNHVKASELLASIRDNLQPEGLLTIAVPDYLSWGMLFYDCDYTHAYPLTKRRLVKLLKDNGFDVLYCDYYSGCYFGRLAWILGRTLKLLYSEAINSLFFSKNDLLYRGILTFIPNLLIVARKTGIRQ